MDRILDRWDMQEKAGYYSIGMKDLPMTDEAKTIERLTREIGDLRTALARAESANTAKNDFLTSMSHELRTPLNSILGFSQVLSEKFFGALNEKQLEYLKEIRTSGEYLLELINDVLDIAKIEIGNLELEKTAVSIKALLEHCLITIKEKCAKHRVQISLKAAADGNGLEVVADSRKIKRALYDVISYAIRITPDGGKIDVRAGAQGKAVVIEIENSGPCVAPEDREGVFQEFYHVKNESGGKPGGGVGLSMARRLVELHGGNLRLEGGGQEAGSRFVLELPVTSL